MDEHNAVPGHIMVPMSDRLFSQTYYNFQKRDALSFIFSLIKIGTAPIAMWFCQGNLSLKVWYVFLLWISIIQLFYYRKRLLMFKQIYIFLSMALKLKHCARVSLPEHEAFTANTIKSRIHPIFDFNDPSKRKVSFFEEIKLRYYLRYYFQSQSCMLFAVNKMHYPAFLSTMLTGIMYLVMSSQYISWPEFYMVFMLFLGFLQYFEDYIVFLLIAVGLIPALLIWLIYHLIKQIRKKVRRIKTENLLNQVDFNMEIQGDHVCQLCRGEYKMDDKLVRLACNQTHHFHAFCIKIYLENRGNCPICKKEIKGQELIS